VRGDRRRRNQGRSQPKLVCYRCNGTDHLGIAFPLTHGLIQIESFPCE
jgi:hypothetical protein